MSAVFTPSRDTVLCKLVFVEPQSDRDALPRPPTLWGPQGRGRTAGRTGPAVLPGRLLHQAGDGRPAPVLRNDTGISVRKDGQNESEDLTLAARNALLNMIEHLETRGFNRQQAYALCSAAVDLRISQTVDVPNLLASALLPLDILM